MIEHVCPSDHEISKSARVGLERNCGRSGGACGENRSAREATFVMAKTKVISCDGIGNEFGDRNSNVVKLYKTFVRDENQTADYHPGVG
jgi:uncharacterized protein (DUF2235 family)